MYPCGSSVLRSSEDDMDCVSDLAMPAMRAISSSELRGRFRRVRILIFSGSTSRSCGKKVL